MICGLYTRPLPVKADQAIVYIQQLEFLFYKRVILKLSKYVHYFEINNSPVFVQ